MTRKARTTKSKAPRKRAVAARNRKAPKRLRLAKKSGAKPKRGRKRLKLWQLVFVEP